MIDFDAVGQSLALLFLPHNLMWLLLGFAAGVVVGAIPGFSEGTFLAMVLPFTVYLDPWTALIFMSAVYMAAEMAGSYPAILINMPGTAGTFATTIEGYPLTRRGKAVGALGCSMTASLLGGLFGSIVYLVAGPFVAHYALAFGSPAMFMVALLGVTAVSSLAEQSLAKGLVSGALGLLIATTGIDPIVGEPRATFGLIGLYDGIPLIAALIGLFGFSELLRLAGERGGTPGGRASANWVGDLLEGCRGALSHGWAALRSSVIGVVIGIIPGTGAATASVVSYGQGRQWARTPQSFGKGSYEGLVCSDSAKDACVPGSLIPTLALGIPGSGTAVIFLAVLSLQGMHPGPGFWGEHLTEAYAIGFTFLISSLLILLVCFPMVRQIARIAYIPSRLLIPLVSVFMFVGVYSYRNSSFDMFVMVFFGALGWLLRRYGYSPSALLLGLILGPMMEQNLSRTMALGGPQLFVTDPVSLVLFGCVVLSLVAPWLLARRTANPSPSGNAGSPTGAEDLR